MTRKSLSQIALICLAILQHSHSTDKQIISTGIHSFPNALPGKVLVSKKVWDPITHQIQYFSDYLEIPNADELYNLLLEERRLDRKKYGALLGRLKSRFEVMKDEDRAKVIVTLRYPEGIQHPSKLEHSSDYLENYSRQIASIQPVLSLENFFEKHGMGRPIRLGKAHGIYELPKYKLKEIMFDEDVVSISDFNEDSPLINRSSLLPTLFAQGSNPALISLARSAYNHSNAVVPTNAGNQVKASTFEVGLDQTFLNCIGVNPIVWDPIVPGANPPSYDLHSMETFRCLSATAPAARFYHRNSVYYTFEIPWIQTHGIQTSSLSYTRGYSRLPTEAEFREMDDMAYKSPFTVFTNGTANEGWTLEAHWKPYNAISVGNVLHRNQNTFLINPCFTAPSVSGGCTQTRNPEQIYGGNCLRPADGYYTYCSSDREMPHIVVPGNTPTVDLTNCISTPMREPCLPTPTENIWCGTSLSAPVANGIAADVIAADARMVSWPEKVRATLILTAENVDGGEWTHTFDGRDGTGVINGASAVDFAKTHVAKGPGQSATQKGMGIGQISAANWGTPLVYNIAIPSTKPPGQYLRVVLTWDSNPSLTAFVNELSDLDLSVVSGGITKTSASYNSNVEVVHFTHGEVTAGSTIQATVNKFANRIPANGTANYFYYCIAWAWVDSHAP